MRAWLVGAIALSAVSSFSCVKFDPDPPAPVYVIVRVESDPGKPLAAADVTFAGKTIATTDAKGVAKLELKGRQGDSYEVNVACPDGYESPLKPVVVTLRRLANPSELPEYDVTCPPMTRTIVVAIRTENGPNLPVVYLGREVARTDTFGAAHVLLRDLPRDAQFDLMLDTSGKPAEQLRPKSPTASFAVKGQDDVFTFDQRFTVEAKPKQTYYGPSKPKGPVALPTKVMP